MNDSKQINSNKLSIAQYWSQNVLRFRWTVLILTAVIFGLTAAGLPKIQISNDYRYFFGEDNPQRLAFEKLQQVYSKDDSVILAVKPKEGSIFQPRTIQLIHELTQESWKIPYSYRVDSITNFQATKAVEDDLIVRDLYKEGDPLDQKQLDYIRDTSLSEPLLAGQIVSRDGKVTGVNVRVNLPGKSPMEGPEVAQYTREFIKEIKSRYQDHEIHLTGFAMLNNASNEAGMHDMMTLIPLMYLIILAITYYFLRSLLASLATFVVLFLSVVGAMGMAGHLGIPITPPSSIAPTVILTLAIADSIHILKSVLSFMARGMSKSEALVEGLRINFQAVFLTSFTTAIGFLSLNLSDTPPFHDLGNMAAMGVLFAFLFSISTLVILIDILPVRVKPMSALESTSVNPLVQALSNTVKWAPGSVIFIMASLTIFFFLQIPKIKLNDQFVRYYDYRIEFRGETEWVMKNLSGIYQLSFDIQSSGSQGIADPEYLYLVDQFAKMYREQPGVTHVNTITDTFKRLNKNLHGDDQSMYKLPENREMAAQYLLLYEMSLPYGLDLNNQINVDKSATRVIVTLGDLDTQGFLDLAAMGENWLKVNTPKYMHATAAGPTVMFSHITNRNVRAMFFGTLLAFGLISLTLVLSLRSFKYGLISLVPNIIPMGIAFGVWSLTVGEAGFAIAIVGSVTLGIVVDDTVHFLSKYVLAKREKGLNSDEAIDYAFQSVGPALIATSAILTLGFSVLLLSAFKLNFILGALSAMTIFIALLIDFTLLPALLKIIDRTGESSNKEKK